MNPTPETAINSDPISLQAVPAAEAQLLTKAVSNPDNPPWGILAALTAWFVSIGALFIVPNFGVLPYLAYRYSGIPTTREMLLRDKTFVFLFVLGWLPAHLLTLAVVWAIATRFGKQSLKAAVGWSWSPNFGVWKSSALAISLFVVTLFLLGFFGQQKTDLDRILESSRAAAVTLALIAVATAPLVEEMIYRGLLYSAFQRVVGRWSAVILVASMFAGLHVFQYWPNVAAIASIALLSFVLTMIRARTGRLLPCFVIHFIFNGIQSLIIILEPYLRALSELWRHETVNSLLINLMRFPN